MADTEALADLLAERDRLRQLTEMQAANIERQADSIQKLMEQSERRKEYADRLRADVRELVEFVLVAEETALCDDSVEATSTTWAHLSKARALLAKHNPLQAMADNACEMGLSYEDGSKT